MRADCLLKVEKNPQPSPVLLRRVGKISLKVLACAVALQCLLHQAASSSRRTSGSARGDRRLGYRQLLVHEFSSQLLGLNRELTTGL